MVPSEPAAATRPTVWLRFSGGVARETTPISTPKAVPAVPMPSRKPATSRPTAQCARTPSAAGPRRRAARSTIRIGRGPCLSASAPTNGCAMPQTMFCSAIAKPKVAAEMPASSVIGRMNRPRLCRRPMQIEMMMPLRTSSRIIARRLDGSHGRFIPPMMPQCSRVSQTQFRDARDACRRIVKQHDRRCHEQFPPRGLDHSRTRSWRCARARHVRPIPTRSSRCASSSPRGRAAATISPRACSPTSSAALLKQQFIVENRPGAGGVIGQTAVLKSPPDGYTLLLAGGSMAGARFVNAAATYDLMRDFTPISVIETSPFALVAQPDAAGEGPEGVHRARAKSQPGQAQLRHHRRGADPVVGGVPLQPHGGRQRRRRHLQGHGRGDDRSDGRAPGLLRHRAGHRARDQGQAARARGDLGGALARCCPTCRPWRKPDCRATTCRPGAASWARRACRPKWWRSSTRRSSRRSPRPTCASASPRPAQCRSAARPRGCASATQHWMGIFEKIAKDAGVKPQ